LEKAIYECLKMYLELVKTHHTRLINRVRQLLRQLFASESILQLVSSSSIAPLEMYFEDRIDVKLTSNIPAFGMIIQNLTADEPHLSAMIAPPLKTLTLQLALQSKRILTALTLHHGTLQEVNTDAYQIGGRDWEVTGCFYGGDMKRVRPFYEGRDAEECSIDKHQQDEQVCQKYYETYKKDKLTGGLMAL
jgi:hypothetical protein